MLLPRPTTTTTTTTISTLLQHCWKPAITGCSSTTALAFRSRSRSFATVVDPTTDQHESASGLTVDPREIARLALVDAAAKQAPRYEAVRANPFPRKVQAWVHEFQTGRPYTIDKLDIGVFGTTPRVDLMHRAVVWQRDGMRQGTHATKGISDVRGTTRKGAPQKGRGRARVGTVRAPQFRGGASVFGPTPRDHSTKLPLKVQLAALRSALSTKYAQDQLVIVDALQMNEYKTRAFVDLVQRHHWMNRSLLLTTGRSAVEKNLRIASNNVPRVECTRAEELDVYRMLQYDLLILDRVAVEALEEKLRLE